ncbi:unnamed protein product [Rhizophagus irregularis]|nr:unnamed protein product [Rhizophagus irregularis]
MNTPKNQIRKIDSESESYTMSGFSNNPSEQCIQMLQAGFTPSTTRNLKSVLSSTLKEAGRDERTGLPFGIIDDDVILASNPCGLPSDIIKVKAARNMDLSIYYNVVIFPVNAAKEDDISLATYLSGGDYGGDKIFCCWYPRIVKNYKNSPLLALDSRIKSAFNVNNQTIDYLLSSVKSSQIESKIQGIILDIHFKNMETPRARINGVHFGIKEKNVDPDPHTYSFWNNEENEECKSVDYEFLRNFLNTPPVEKYKKLVNLSSAQIKFQYKKSISNWIVYDSSTDSTN